MATTAAIIAASVATAASVGSGAYQASQSGGGSTRQPRFVTPPEAPYERALREYTTRLLAQGATSQPMSLLQYIAGGQQGGFNLGNTAETPGEMVGLRQVGSKGQQIPWGTPGQSQLTPEQLMFLASEPHTRVGDNPRINREVNQAKRLGRLEDLPQTTQRQGREANLRKKLQGTPFGG